MMQKNVGLAVLAIFMLTLILWPHAPVVPQSRANGTAAIGGPFTLTDTHGRTVHDTDLLGKPALIYLGYSRCPDICPTTLAAMGKALKSMGDRASNVSVAFITLDPAHDTPDVLAGYLAQFDSRIIGLTGTRAQIEAVVRDYKASYVPAGSDPAAPAAIDHSGLLYLMDAQGRYLRHFESGVQRATLASALTEASRPAVGR